MNEIIFKILVMVLAMLLPASLFAQQMDHSTMSHENGQHMTSDPAPPEAMDSGQQHMTQPDQHDMSIMNHGNQHSVAIPEGPSTLGRLQRLDALPPSGKSREADYDGSYFMQSTALNQPLEVKCALGSRGLIMLDNETWIKCGGKPNGWSKGVHTAQPGMDHSKHMSH